MRWRLMLPAFALLFVMAGCAQTSHFGVADKALTTPSEFRETEAAIASAEMSEGAKHCPEKIAEARELGRRAVENYWMGRDCVAMGLFAQARELARDAEACQPLVKETPPPPPPPPAPSPPPPPPPAPISLPTGHFDFDKAVLRTETIAKLDRAAEMMRDNPAVMVEIQGHTCSTGPAEYNMELGYRRADAAFEYLKTKGISPDRLRKVSYGETMPVASNATDEGREQNRRVDLVRLN